ncbi:MAG: hypothetical protein E7620_03575 [Ruminococcaceae bacterium]|nr:hypothetical protein [Oscillospiraceae bacterium]
MKKYTLICLLLAALMLLASCGDGSSHGGGILPTHASGQLSATKEPSVWDGLPEVDYGDEDFTIFTINTANFRSNMLGQEGEDIVNQAQLKAKLAVNEILHVNLMEYPVGNDMKQFTNSIYAGLDSYSIGYGRCTFAIQMFNEGLIIPYDQISTIDLSGGWWNHAVNDSLSVNHKQYVALGSFDLSTYDYTHAMLFNKVMAESYHYDLYSEVTEKTWTFDRFYEIITEVSTGESVENPIYGYLCQSKEVLPNFWIAADQLTVAKDAETDTPFLACKGEKFDTVFRRTFEMLRENGTWYYVVDGNDVPDVNINLFNGNQALFMDSTFYYVNRLRAENEHFGILPYPMWGEGQTEYRSRIEYYMPGVIPSVVTDRERTGVVLEALNRAYSTMVTESYYESVLRLKNSTDEDSYEMVGLIFATQVIDIGDTTLNATIRDGIFAPMWVRNKPTLQSYLASMEGVVERYLQSEKEA